MWKALVGAVSVIVKTDVSFEALIMMMGIILHISTQNWNQEYARVQLLYTEHWTTT